jgi:micrococcal nuclease
VINEVDGDTIDLDTGERVRYVMVDTPELSSDDCYSLEAKEFNSQ